MINTNCDISDKQYIQQCEANWLNIGLLSHADLTPYNKSVGLYRALLDGRLVYIGRAIEYANGGLRKRLNDYRRASDSARKHNSGQKLYEFKEKLIIEILITGSDKNAAEVAKKLEIKLIQKYKPSWNNQLK